MNEHITIRLFDNSRDREAVVLLWSTVFGYATAHNDPDFVITQKLAADDGLFFIADRSGCVIGTVIAGYDGHRGWIYSLAVNPQERGIGVGAALVLQAEAALRDRGCVKVNLQVLADNSEVVGFYQKMGYNVEPRISMGKLLQSHSADQAKTRHS